VLGEEERAREWIERGLLLDPDNQYMRYNVGCVLAAQLKDDETAMEVLKPFFDQVNTASQLKHIEADPDLERLRDKPQFKVMLATAKQRLRLSGEDQNASAMPLTEAK
jgi:adenylate cyclase